jgi:hypothetical protein
VVGAVTATAQDTRGVQQAGLLVELVGPAGCGKSTVARALAAQDRTTWTSIWGQPKLRHVVSGLLVAPTCLALCRRSHSLVLTECGQLIRLKSLQQAVRSVGLANQRLVVLDEGPVFSLAWLLGFGHESLRRNMGPWWRAAVHQWAETLDAVVILDAPDATLARRIRMREEQHQMKDGTNHEIRDFLARWRSAFEHVLAAFASTRRGPPVLRLSTEHEPADRIASRLLAAFQGARDGN